LRKGIFNFQFSIHRYLQGGIYCGFGVKFQAKQGKKALPSLKLEVV
jgi:hypothetical protein